tara:strand:- start:107 stop:862 length:756 start_codon:yes stop_codon:yes gene_type:complete
MPLVDLIIVSSICSKKQEDNLSSVIKSLSHPQKHIFSSKYILFDGAPSAHLKVDYERYIKYKKYYSVNYPDFKIIENLDCLYYRNNLEKFIRGNFDGLAENLLIIQDDIILNDFDLKTVLESKALFSECKILYFREDRLRCNHWFNEVHPSGFNEIGSSESQDLIKKHGWNEKAYLITKDNLIEILDNLPIAGGSQKQGKFIHSYYQNMMKRQTWQTITEEEQLDYWKLWGSYEHKTIHHKHLSTKRSSFT